MSFIELGEAIRPTISPILGQKDNIMTEQFDKSQEDLDFDSRTALDDIREGKDKEIKINGTQVPVFLAETALKNLFALESFQNRKTDIVISSQGEKEIFTTDTTGVAVDQSDKMTNRIREAAKVVKMHNRPNRAA